LPDGNEQCGPIPDGCGGVLNCGDCSQLGASYTCTGDECVCVPLTSPTNCGPGVCGTLPNGCGGTYTCAC
jgi:hypothetical protein